jgi:tetratricopeptide (TPR) repeat protein
LIPILALAVAAAAPQTGACPDLVSPEALVCHALDAEKKGDHAAAAQAFEEAAKASSDKDPKTARMWAAAGNLWIAAQQPGKAAFDLDRALAMKGLEAEQRGEALLDRARAAQEQNDLAPSDATVLFEAGHVAHFTGDDDKARSYWMRAAGSDPNGETGKAAAKAVEMLGVTPTVKLDSTPPK